MCIRDRFTISVTQSCTPNTWYLDADNDGYYIGTGITQCESPGIGYRYIGILGSNDCNDNVAGITPGATEACDAIDNDCDGSTDEGVLTTYYADVDADGFGNPSSSTQACAQPGGYVTNNTDCDDNDALEKPGQVWYKDNDNDNFGQTGAASITQCLRPVSYTHLNCFHRYLWGYLQLDQQQYSDWPCSQWYRQHRELHS